MDEPSVEEVSLEDVPFYRGSTECDHYMVLEGIGTAVCSKNCGHGCSIDLKESRIVDGKIVELA